MKAAPAARSWIAAGVRHELLTRALPALRHDMAAPVSVIRMALLMLKRQVAAPTVDAAACEQRLALVDDQIGALVKAVRSLRDWELAIGDDGLTRSALVAQCTGLMRPAFDLQGVSLSVDEALVSSEDETVWPEGAALRYLVLGALGYLHDTVEEVGRITVRGDGSDALHFSASLRDPDQVDRVADAHRAPRALAIDGIALQSLADDLGYALTVAPDTVRLELAAPR
ncbi:MAG: hypothetical protein EOO26_07935 [Comamonadaceae bacterium]|nr:MAG: hypothetical protein EOO26_07935 [Comamonadaceae bacterium]